MQPDELVDTVRTATTGLSADDLPRALVRALATALGVRGVLLSRAIGESRVRTLAVWIDGAPLRDFAYDLAGSPCERVFADGQLVCPTRVQQQFPADRDLVRLGLDSYVGVLLQTADGHPRGHLAALHGDSLDPTRASQIHAVLTRCAALCP